MVAAEAEEKREAPVAAWCRDTLHLEREALENPKVNGRPRARRQARW